MKTTIFALVVLSFLGASSAFGQSAPVLSGTAAPVMMTEHPLHASEHAMATESSLLSNSGYSYAQGEQPLAEFGGSLKQETPLGDIARAFRKGRTATTIATPAPKPAKVTEN
jgi:hypothetical protein